MKAAIKLYMSSPEGERFDSINKYISDDLASNTLPRMILTIPILPMTLILPMMPM